MTDDVEDLIALLKEKDTDSDKSVHFFFPNGLDNGQQTSDHVVIDASGFTGKFAVFEKRLHFASVGRFSNTCP